MLKLLNKSFSLFLVLKKSLTFLTDRNSDVRANVTQRKRKYDEDDDNETASKIQKTNAMQMSRNRKKTRKALIEKKMLI